MEVAANVRLVRCPKCENLLPELPNFSLYKCGGCGAVLKAKKKGILEDEFSEISGDEKGVAISEGGSKINASDIHMETAEINERNRVERIHNERVSLDGSFAPHGVTDRDLSRRGKERIREMEQFDDDYSKYSHQGLARNRNYGSNVDSSEYVNFHGERAYNDIRTPMESSRSRPVIDQWGMQSQGRFGNIAHHGEGPSSYDMNPYYEQQGGGMRYPSHEFDGLARVENLENGRAELLRKLDELKDQLSRSCEMTEMPKQRVDIDQRVVSPDPYSRYHRDAYVNKKQLAPDEMAALYLRQTSEYVPYTDRYGSGFKDPYSQRGYSREYANTYHPEMHRPPHQPQSQYTHRPYEGHFPSYYGNDNYDPLMLHQPACSCVQCYNKNWNLPPKVDPLGLYNGRSMNEPSNPNYHNHLNPLRNGHISGGLNSHNSRESLPLNSSDFDSENDGLSHHRPRKAVVARRNEQVWRPLGGGAPFLVCTNCFELLKLPRKHISHAKKEHKLKCGACSSIILFEIGKNGFIASISASVDQVEIDENVRSCSNDFDESQPKISSPIDNKSNSSESEKHLDRSSSTSSLSEDIEIPEKLVTPTIHDSPPAELSLTKDEPTPHPDLSSQGHDGNCSDNIVVARFDKGSESKRSDRHDSVKDGAVASEMDVSLNEFSNSSVSRDSEEISKEDNQRANKGGIFAAFIKNGFRDFGPPQVSVNGHLIPDRVVKKAEKLAGPIQPGDYWYDIQAGFWGVMGHPCLGIIMPNIEEFNYPMPEKCAAGNTGVFVNGRELHRKDLDLLVNRGLPNIRNGSYQVDISGKVIDEHTGEELDGLGKLAPTVEKEKHGFGMKVPRFIAESQR